MTPGVAKRTTTHPATCCTRRRLLYRVYNDTPTRPTPLHIPVPLLTTRNCAHAACGSARLALAGIVPVPPGATRRALRRMLHLLALIADLGNMNRVG